MRMRHLLFLPIFLLLAFSVAERHDTLTSEDYWNTALPNTPIPKSLRDRLTPASPVSKQGNVDVPTVLDGNHAKADRGNKEDEAYRNSVAYYYEVKADRGNKEDEAYLNSVAYYYEVKADQGNNEDEAYLNSVAYYYEVKADQGSLREGLSIPLKNGYHVKGGQDKRSVIVESAIKSVVPISPPGSPLFFQEKDFHPGAVARLSFKQRISGGHLLTPAEARSIPFSTGKLREILTLLSVQPNSPRAAMMAKVLRTCERPTTSAEKLRCCATLESMADFITSNLATQHVKTVATTVEKGGEATTVSTLQTYTVLSTEPVQMEVPTMVVCHMLPYPYTVYHCHVIPHTKPYVAHLVGEDGSTKVEAAVMCHETSTWSTQSRALKDLNLKPGEANVCHFLPLGDMAWIPTKSTDDGKGHLSA